MREQQLFTKKDLYTKYTYVCDKCWVQYTNVLNKAYIYHKNDREKINICSNCAKDLLLNHSWENLFHKWEIYSIETSLPTVYCYGCWRLIYDNWYDEYCPKCSNGRYWYRYCSNCWKVHRYNDVCDYWLVSNYRLLNASNDSNSLNMHTNRDSKSWYAKWISKLATSWQQEIMKTLPFQEERKLPLGMLEDLEEFYEDNYHNDLNWDWYFDNYFFRQPTEITGEIEYKRYDWLKAFSRKLSDISEHCETDIAQWKKANKYRNHYFKNISDDWLITWNYIDMFWGVREKKESINKFLQDNGMIEDKISLSRKIFYRLSSDINHKMLAFNINYSLGSCQQPHNSESYAQWAYDAVTNWCNCPILLYNSKIDYEQKKNPIGRITSRLMYDKDWHMYILVDRLYQDWSLSGSKIKWMMYKLIIEDLQRQWYKVIVTNYSAHDSSTLQYLIALGMKKWDAVTNLFQPLRRLFNVWWEDWECWYYSDWWIEVIRAWINWLERATDYLDKAYLVS